AHRASTCATRSRHARVFPSPTSTKTATTGATGGSGGSSESKSSIARALSALPRLPLFGGPLVGFAAFCVRGHRCYVLIENAGELFSSLFHATERGRVCRFGFFELPSPCLDVLA